MSRFVMEPSLFTQHPDTMLGRMFGGVDYVTVWIKSSKLNIKFIIFVFLN